MPNSHRIVGPIQRLHRIACGECGWNIAVYSTTDAELRQCPWCGWSDLEISTCSRHGAAARIICATHGEATVQVLDEAMHPDDFMGDLFCPFCTDPALS